MQSDSGNPIGLLLALSSSILQPGVLSHAQKESHSKSNSLYSQSVLLAGNTGTATTIQPLRVMQPPRASLATSPETREFISPQPTTSPQVRLLLLWAWLVKLLLASLSLSYSSIL